MNARFAPAGQNAPRWLAYQSNESGQNQIYVQGISPNDGKYQISTSGGTQPGWRGDGNELFYLSSDQKLMAVPMKLGTTVESGTPHELFAIRISGPSASLDVLYAVSSDGQRFLVIAPADGDVAAAPPPLTVVLNWTAGLKK